MNNRFIIDDLRKAGDSALRGPILGDIDLTILLYTYTNASADKVQILKMYLDIF